MQLSQSIQQFNKLSYKPLVTGQKVQTRKFQARAERELYFPGAESPPYLDGSLAGDFGFDPLRLSENDVARTWFVQAEINNARWAMLGVAGILIPGILKKIGILNVPEWYDAGVLYPFPFLKINSTQGAAAGVFFAAQFFFFFPAEFKRIQDLLNPGSQNEKAFLGNGPSLGGAEEALKGSGENGYPGSIFDPLKFVSGKPEDSVKDLKLREINNGRLAMLAWLGFNAQHLATGKGPFDNLFDHIADPTHNNVGTNGLSVPFL